MLNGEFQAVTHGSKQPNSWETNLDYIESGRVAECGGSDSPATWAGTRQERL